MNNKNDYNYTGKEPGSEKQGGQKFSFRNMKTFDSFKIPTYRIYYGAITGQWLGMSSQMLVLSLLMYRLTGSGAMIGIMAIAQAVPQITLSLFGGTIADRFQKKYIMLAGQIVSAMVSCGIATGLATGLISTANPGSWWFLSLSAVMQGTIMGLVLPAQMSIVPEIVGQERVTNGISLMLMANTVTRLIGPAAAGFLIDAFDFATVYYLMAAMYVIAIVFTLFIPRTSAKITRTTSAMSDMANGLKYIRGETYILLIIVFTLCHVVAGQPYMQLMAIFTEDILKVGASGLGILTAVSSAGAIVGTLVIASLPNKKRGLMLIMSGIILGISVIVFAWSKSWVLSIAIMPLAGVGPALHGTLANSLIQYYAKPEYRGRMQSFISMSAGLANFGTFFAGMLTGVIGVEWAVGGMAIFLTIASIGFLAFARPLTRLD